MNNCEAFERLASAMIDNETKHAERKELYRHLATCERCDAFLTDVMALQVAAARRGIRVLPVREYDPDVLPARQPVRGPFRSAMHSAMKKRLSVPVSVMGALAVFIAAIIIAVSRTNEMVPAAQPVQQTEMTQAVLRLPVVKIP
jgi:anti-sigma factor RsiW